jgi:hypothetical protein
MKNLAFIIFIFIISSCSKVGPTATSVKGTVTDLVTGEPMVDIKIIIEKTSFRLSGTKTKRIATLRTNDEGKFEDSFSAGLSGSYRCYIDLETPNLVRSLGSADNISEDIDEGEENIIEFKTTLGGYIKEYFIDVDCDLSVSVEIDRQHEIPETTRNLTFTIDQCRSLIDDEFILTPQGLYIYKWRTFRGDEVLTENVDSFYLEIGERKEFTIEW